MSKFRHFQASILEEFDKCQEIELIVQNPNINNTDEIFYAHIIEQSKKYDYYLLKCEFNLLFIDNQYCPYVTSELYGNKTTCYWYKLLENVITDFKKRIYFQSYSRNAFYHNC